MRPGSLVGYPDVKPVQPSAVLADGTMQSGVQDTTGMVAYVAKPGGPPDTASYMWAGYAVALGLYLGYIALMLRRTVQLRRKLAACGDGDGKGL